MLTLAAGGGRREDRSPIGGSDAERFELARGLAAMTLATSHEPEASTLLDSAREGAGTAGRAATAALRAYPPQRAHDDAAGSDEARLALAATTGDLRGLDALTRPPLAPPVSTTDEQHRPGEAARARLLETLATLGDTRALPLARATRHDESARVRLAAARVLAAFGDPEADAACADLVKDDATLKDGIELARAVGRRSASAATDRGARLDLLKAIAARLAASSDVDLRRACLDALGGFATPEAVAAIAPFLADPALAVDAAEALARAPRSEAMTALLAFAGASSAEGKRLALRAATMRHALGDDTSDAEATARSFADLASALAGGRSAEDRAVARAYLVVLGRLRAEPGARRRRRRGAPARCWPSPRSTARWPCAPPPPTPIRWCARSPTLGWRTRRPSRWPPSSSAGASAKARSTLPWLAPRPRLARDDERRAAPRLAAIVRSAGTAARRCVASPVRRHPTGAAAWPSWRRTSRTWRSVARRSPGWSRRSIPRRCGRPPRHQRAPRPRSAVPRPRQRRPPGRRHPRGRLAPLGSSPGQRPLPGAPGHRRERPRARLRCRRRRARARGVRRAEAAAACAPRPAYQPAAAQ